MWIVKLKSKAQIKSRSRSRCPHPYQSRHSDTIPGARLLIHLWSSMFIDIDIYTYLHSALISCKDTSSSFCHSICTQSDYIHTLTGLASELLLGTVGGGLVPTRLSVRIQCIRSSPSLGGPTISLAFLPNSPANLHVSNLYSVPSAWSPSDPRWGASVQTSACSTTHFW